MPNDFVNIVKKYGPVVLISAAVGAGIYALATAAPPEEEERPPIIIQNGTVEFRPAYADSTYNDKGYWEEIGNSGKYRYTHDHLSGPNDMKNEIYNGTCLGAKWGNGPLTFTYTDGSSTWTLNVHVTGKYLQVDPQSGQLGTIDPSDHSHLTVGTLGVKTWITKVEPSGGSGDYCTFAKEGNPLIRVAQKR